MIPNSIYKFKKDPKLVSVYLLVEHQGENLIPCNSNFPELKEFPPVYKIKPKGTGKIGQGHIDINHKRSNPKSEFDYYIGLKRTYDLQKGKPSYVVLGGFSMCELDSEKSFSDSRNIGLNHAVLIEWKNNRSDLILYFFNDKGNLSKEIFDRWLNGEIVTEFVINESLPLINKKVLSGKQD